MEYVVNASQMKRYDSNTMEYFGVPGLVLMERAALAAAEILKENLPLSTKRPVRILVLCGSGNNGGDGLAMGRLLCQQGYEVDFVMVQQNGKLSEQAGIQLSIIRQYGWRVYSFPDWPTGSYDGCVDALFGIGLTRPVEGIYAEVLERFAQIKGFRMALDMPSGIHTDTGAVMGYAVPADVTVTFGFKKRGQLFYPGCLYTGKLVCAPIGITADSFLEQKPETFTLAADGSELFGLLPKRVESGNKGTFGKVLLIAGSPRMGGACRLAAESVLRTGAGMVKVLTAAENRDVLLRALPEAMIVTYTAQDELEAVVREALPWADVIGIGPGLGTEEAAGRILHTVITESKQPLVLDADALNLLAESPRKSKEQSVGQSGWQPLMELLAGMQKEAQTRRELILTPHLGEFARLCGVKTETVQPVEERCRRAAELVRKLQTQIAVKDARTLVFIADGTVYINCTGNDGMATAGSGDVLTGMITALLAQGLPAARAASTGVYLHGVAGDQAAKKLGPYAMLAGDLIEAEKTLLQ